MRETSNVKHQTSGDHHQSMGDDSPIIETQGLTRTFGSHKAVDHLDLSVRRGEIFGLVGPDGAGKTTTLRMLTGIMRPTEGTAKIAVGDRHDDRERYDIGTDPELIKLYIGYMPQQFSLYSDLTVLENLHFFADIFEVSKAARQKNIPRLLSFSRLERFSDRRAGRLSGGMQKKLGLACTLIHQPELIFLDEPTTGVDPVSRREFWDILGELHLEGITILVCTPYMDEAERCSRVGLMYNGTIIACDKPEGLQQRVKGELLEILTDRLESALQLLEARGPGVQEVQTYGNLIHLFVDDATRRKAEIRTLLTSEGFTVSWMRQTAPRMEEAFIHLIREQTMGQGT
jgi:ABC-2 type transport system ATP-binding protein